MTFSTCAPTGVAGIDVLNHPVGANPGVEICAPVALVFAADCTYQLSWSETATFSREPCAKPDGVKNPAPIARIASILPFWNFTRFPPDA